MDSILKNKRFKLFWLATAIAQTGSFFTVIALPWLVLSITGNDPVTTSLVMAAISLPQGIFILFGGALSDSLSPKKVILVSRSLFVCALMSLAVLVYLGITPLWLIFCYALVFGTLTGFGIPATQSFLPSLLPDEHLGAGNGIVIGTMQVAQMLGPILAGWLIWYGGNFTSFDSHIVEHMGISFAFTVDAIAMSISLFIFLFVKAEAKNKVSHAVWLLFLQGGRFCWHDKSIRMVLFYVMTMSFFLHGPLYAALPIFTKINLGLAEKAYGNLFAMISLGTLCGAGVGLFKFMNKRLGATVLVCDLIAGISLYFLAKQNTVMSAGAVLIMIGFLGGIVMIVGTTWFQVRTPGSYMGRVMGVLMFCIVGLIPISATLSGLIIKTTSVDYLLSGAGLMMIAFSLLGLLIPFSRNLGSHPPLEESFIRRLELKI
ncbi:MAG: MFS transporter [Pseudomonadota bacterium]